MCRFVAYSGEPVRLHDLLYRPEHSLVKQSVAALDEEDRVNADGFGVGWYAPEVSPAPAVFRSPQPVGSSAALRSISTLIRSGLVFAHVRAASPGLEVSEQNCHPFAAGPFLWMHNGTVGGHAGFKDWARRYLSAPAFARIRGTTDSEYLFAHFLEEWEDAQQPEESTALVEVLRKTLRLLADVLRDSGIREPSTLNIALTDGRTIIAARHAIGSSTPPLSLYLARNVRLRCEGSSCRFERAASGGPTAAVIASEPMFTDPAWEEVPPERIVAVRASGEVDQVTI